MALRPQHGVDFLIETLRHEETGKITLCALGPLTNIAIALVKAPEVAERIGELVVMGGALVWAVESTRRANWNEVLAKSNAETARASEIKAKEQTEEALAHKKAAEKAKQELAKY